MDSYVITIMGNKKSVGAADRCIASAKRYGLGVKKFPAITPKSKPLTIAKKEGIDPRGFQEVYSRFENCLSAFLSHYSLWKQCVEKGTPMIIFEHDAVVINELPLNHVFIGCVNIGMPSYGKWNQPSQLGIGPLTTKRYFPGAHAYMINPKGATALINQAKEIAKPTDVFLNIDTFPWLQEYYPFAAKADDSFTTIQNQTGCLAKHNYGEEYGIENIQ
jgi:GR25 family glycosyltransferase involved in LPS biosynthesis